MDGSDESRATTAAVTEPSAQRRRHRGIVTTLLLLATLIGIIGSFAVWSARQLLETDQWAETSSHLLENEEIRTAVGTFLVEELFANVDVEGEIAGALPPRLAPLAGPASGGLRRLADRAAPQLLAQPRIQALWEEINRDAHDRFVAVVNGEAPAVSEPAARSTSTSASSSSSSAPTSGSAPQQGSPPTWPSST